MEQISILFFALSSFLAIDNPNVVADKTLVTIQPQSQQIHIIQNNLFIPVHVDADLTRINQQYADFITQTTQNSPWTKNLDSFSDKQIVFSTQSEQLSADITLTYNNVQDLRAFGVWYDPNNNQFSINHVPSDNLQTDEGQLIDNYWIFEGDQPFSFTLTPFKKLPNNYQKLMIKKL